HAPGERVPIASAHMRSRHPCYGARVFGRPTQAGNGKSPGAVELFLPATRLSVRADSAQRVAAGPSQLSGALACRRPVAEASGDIERRGLGEPWSERDFPL